MWRATQSQPRSSAGQLRLRPEGPETLDQLSDLRLDWRSLQNVSIKGDCQSRQDFLSQTPCKDQAQVSLSVSAIAQGTLPYEVIP